MVRNGYDYQMKLQVPALVILVRTEEKKMQNVQKHVWNQLKSYYCCTVSCNRTRTRFINYGVWIRKMQQKLCQLCHQVQWSRFCGADSFLFYMFLLVPQVFVAFASVCSLVFWCGSLGSSLSPAKRLLWKVCQLFLKSVSRSFRIGFCAIACIHSRRHRVSSFTMAWLLYIWNDHVISQTASKSWSEISKFG